MMDRQWKGLVKLSKDGTWEDLQRLRLLRLEVKTLAASDVAADRRAASAGRKRQRG